MSSSLADSDERAAPPWRPTNSVAAEAALRQLECFRKVAEAEIPLLARMATLRVYEPGAHLVVERTVPHMLFVIEQGSVSIVLGEHEGQPLLIALLGRGDICGEGGIFGMRYRRVSARAETRVYALQFLYDELRPLLDQLPTFQAQLRRMFRERLLQTTLAHVPLLNSLNAIERLALTSELDEVQVARGDAVIRQGDTELALYIIAEGQAQIRRDSETLDVMGPGEVLGEMELLTREPHSADVVALTPLHLLSIPLGIFRQLLAEHPEIAAGLEQLVRHRYGLGHDPQRIATLEAATTSGLARGRQVLARVPALCPPGCSLCVQACGKRFGASRIQLNDTQIGAADVLHGCKHCMWSPECVEACPEDALKLDDRGFLFVTDACTGCGACAPACPYTAITMLPMYPPVAGPLDWLRRQLRPPEPISFHPNKCDGCHDHADQACMTACPTGSLRWITLPDVEPHGYPPPTRSATP